MEATGPGETAGSGDTESPAGPQEAGNGEAEVPEKGDPPPGDTEGPAEPQSSGGEEAEVPEKGSADTEGPAAESEQAEAPAERPAWESSESESSQEPEAPAQPAEPEEEEEEEEEEEKEDPEEEAEREALLAEIRELTAERERLRQAGAHVQLLLGEALRVRGGGARAEEAAVAVRPFPERVRELRQLRQLRERAGAACRERVEAHRRGCAESAARAVAAWAAFQARKKAVALPTLGKRRGGREAAAAAVRGIQAREQEKEEAVREARLENIRLKLEIQNLERILKARGETQKDRQLAEMKHMRKENQKLNEKLRELSGEILKLKKKVADAAQILSQFQEKFREVEEVNEGRRAELRAITSALLQKRDLLNSTKRARAQLRVHSLKLQQKCGLLGDETLLRDFEEKVDTIERLSQRLEALKHHHAHLILKQREIQNKTKEASSSSLK